MSKNTPITLLIALFETAGLSLFFGTIIPLVLAPNSLFSVSESFLDHQTLYNLILLIMPVGQLFIAPIWGQLSDQIGRKPALLITSSLSMLSYLLMAIAISNKLLILFIAARMLSAGAAGNLPIAQASLADENVGIKKLRGINLQFIFVSIAFISGPSLVDVLGYQGNFANVYYFLAGCFGLLFLLSCLSFKETLVGLQRKTNDTLNILRFFDLFKIPQLRKLLWIWLTFQCGWNLFFQFSGEYLSTARHVGNQQINHIFGYLGLGVFVVQVIIIQLFGGRLSANRVLPYAILLVGISLLIMGLTPVNTTFYLCLGLYCIGIAFFLTFMTVTLSNAVKDHFQGSVFSLTLASQSLMVLIATVIGNVTMPFYAATPYVFGGLLIIISGILWLKIKPLERQ